MENEVWEKRPLQNNVELMWSYSKQMDVKGATKL